MLSSVPSPCAADVLVDNVTHIRGAMHNIDEARQVELPQPSLPSLRLIWRPTPSPLV
jgi:hypothetical protein